MNFGESISTCFKKYATVEGRASRSEYWWWILFLALGTIATKIVNENIFTLFSLIVLLPSIGVAGRRLHDINRSAWWYLIQFIPLIGFIVMIIWCVQEPVEPNRFGEAPAIDV